MLTFLTKFTKKEYFQYNTEKVNIAIKFTMFELGQASRFIFDGYIDFLGQI